jgi:hypothetical protein
MRTSFLALTQALAAYAMNTGAITAAEELFNELADYARKARDARILEGALMQPRIVAHQGRDFEAAENLYRRFSGRGEW